MLSRCATAMNLLYVVVNMGCVKTVGDLVCELEGLGLCAKMCRPTGAWSEIPNSARASGEDMVVALSESNGNIHSGTDV